MKSIDWPKVLTWAFLILFVVCAVWVMWGCSLSGCNPATIQTVQDVIPHDTTGAVIWIPGLGGAPMYHDSLPCPPCDTQAIQRAFHFDVRKDTAGSHYEVRKDSDVVRIITKQKTDTVLVAYLQKVIKYPTLKERMGMELQGTEFLVLLVFLIFAWKFGKAYIQKHVP